MHDHVILEHGLKDKIIILLTLKLNSQIILPPL